MRQAGKVSGPRCQAELARPNNFSSALHMRRRRGCNWQRRPSLTPTPTPHPPTNGLQSQQLKQQHQQRVQQARNLCAKCAADAIWAFFTYFSFLVLAEQISQPFASRANGKLCLWFACKNFGIQPVSTAHPLVRLPAYPITRLPSSCHKHNLPSAAHTPRNARRMLAKSKSITVQTSDSCMANEFTSFGLVKQTLEKRETRIQRRLLTLARHDDSFYTLPGMKLMVLFSKIYVTGRFIRSYIFLSNNNGIVDVDLSVCLHVCSSV